MKKRILLILLAILLIASCNDSSRGVLQWAYQFAEEEENYNQSYLGNDGTNIYLERDWDIYKAYSSPRENANGNEIRYEKILESSRDDEFPFAVQDGLLYMAYKDRTTGLFNFFYIEIPESGEITKEAAEAAKTENQCTVSGLDNPNITSFAVSRIAVDKIQTLFVLQGASKLDPTNYAVIEINDASLEFTSVVSGTLPANSQMIGDGVLKATSDDPEIDIPDNMNDLYLIEDGKALKIHTFHDSLDYPMGSDGQYAAIASGEICPIDRSYSENGYNGRLRQGELRFDVLDREDNYLTIYKDGNSIVGYLSDNGIYWREDITDDSEVNNKSRPSIVSVSEDADVVPLCFVGKHGTKSHEYLMITQDNGFYIVRPQATGTARLEKIRTGSEYQLSQFL